MEKKSKKNLLQQILRSNQTVFSFKELIFMIENHEEKKLKSKLNYYVNKGQIYHIRRGLYAKDNNYDRFELATKIYTPSYISFETVLNSSGVVFQYYSQIFIASYQSRLVVCDDTAYSFRTVKPEILTNSSGVNIFEKYSIASLERAFLDTVYINKEYYFDNLEPINWERVYELLPAYGDNVSMKLRVDMYYNSYKDSISNFKK